MRMALAAKPSINTMSPMQPHKPYASVVASKLASTKKYHGISEYNRKGGVGGGSLRT